MIAGHCLAVLSWSGCGMHHGQDGRLGAGIVYRATTDIASACALSLVEQLPDVFLRIPRADL